MIKDNEISIAIIGLGYVGLPLAVAFAPRFKTTGFDISTRRVEELRTGRDGTLEVSPEDLSNATDLTFTADCADIAPCNVYIVTVPTPIDASKNPDLGPLRAASESVGKLLSRGDVVIFESTVFPGATEDVCVPILERESGLVFNDGFFAGYSPERINPGDKQHRLENIVKVTAGSTPEAADFVDHLYSSIVSAGTHKASSIRVAEAAKVIENTQRDLNIALMNELSMIFRNMDIDTLEVLEAAGTKWNFLPFRPGLVGGHCIGVDPYYLTHKAEGIGYHPQVILAGRRINDGMGKYISAELAKSMNRKGLLLRDSKILVMGLTFKENCPDLRNSRVFDIIDELASSGANIFAHDPWVNPEEHGNGRYSMVSEMAEGEYDAIVIAVSHSQFKDTGIDTIRSWAKPNGAIFDLKSIFDKDKTDWRL